MTFKTHYNMRDVLPDMEKNTMPSKTIPDSALSVRDILDRFRRGLPIKGAKEPIFDFKAGEEDDGSIMPDLKSMDLVEQQEFAEYLKQQLKEIDERQEKIREQRAEKRKQSKKEWDEWKQFRDEQRRALDPADNILKKPGSGQSPAPSAQDK